MCCVPPYFNFYCTYTYSTYIAMGFLGCPVALYLQYTYVVPKRL